MIIISVSKGNSKMGNIPSFNLPPVESCLNHKTCSSFIGNKGKRHRCYALKSYSMYKNTKSAYDKNFELAKTDLAELESQLTAWLKLNRNTNLFRIHSSGDFFSKEYLDMRVRITLKFPKIRFLAFTKVYGFFKGLTLPKNFSVLLSYMPAINYKSAKKFSEMIGLPMAYASNQDIKERNLVMCLEQVNTKDTVNCANCQLCWKLPELKRPINIQFLPH